MEVEVQKKEDGQPKDGGFLRVFGVIVKCCIVVCIVAMVFHAGLVYVRDRQLSKRLAESKNAFKASVAIPSFQEHVKLKSNQINELEVYDRDGSKRGSSGSCSSEQNCPHDVLITSYAHAGSSIVGRWLGIQDDVFYFYEPLHRVLGEYYYQSDNVVCSIDYHNCWNVADGPSPSYTLAEAMEMIKQIFMCDFTGFESKIWWNFHSRFSGQGWSAFRTCKFNTDSVSGCLVKLTEACNAATHIVIKEPRVNVQHIEELLTNNSHLVVAHIIRDPRAVTATRLRSMWNPWTNNCPDVNFTAHSLCAKIESDYDFYLNNFQAPNFDCRFFAIQFEDLFNQDTFHDKMSMFNYLCFSGGAAAEIAKNACLLNDTVPLVGYLERFRMYLTHQSVSSIDTECTSVYADLGYLPLATEADQKDHVVLSVMNVKTLPFQIPHP